MINEHPPFKGLNIRIPIISPIKGRGFVNQGSGLLLQVLLRKHSQGQGEALILRAPMAGAL